MDQNQQLEQQLIDDIAGFTHSPLKFVLYAFPWGSGELVDQKGPDEWQRGLLEDVEKGLMTLEEALRFATAAGNGVGKSALVAWLILWGMSTYEDCRGVVTANTDTQLRTKTWPELAKWYRLCICKHWFQMTATSLYSVQPGHEKTWRFDMIPWSKERPEAFAGLHNKGKRVILIFDEASAIEGAMTDEGTEILWFAFGNPTRSKGRFFDCFHDLRHRWNNRHVDSRDCKFTNKTEIRQWIEDYGIDSDWVLVHVRGLFPKASDKQFIPTNVVDAALGRNVPESAYIYAPKILTCDPAWSGGDEIVIGLRQGLAFRILMVLAKNDDDGIVAGYLMKFEDEHQADAVFIDFGYGTGIYSFGKQMNRDWMLVEFGGASNDPGFLNKRAEMWNTMKKWLKEGGCIPNDKVLRSDLIGPEYEVLPTGKNAGKIMIETKEDMKKRALPSPNRADALALSFAFPVVKKERGMMGGSGNWGSGVNKDPKDYDPLTD
jgi:hypothetical protein